MASRRDSSRRPEDGRDESAAERADRNWNELLQEFRVLQTGVQILSGFLLILPFQERFGDLDRFQTVMYLMLVAVAAITTAAMLTPIAVHRKVFGKLRKDGTVAVGHNLARLVIALLGLLVTGVTTFVFDLVVGRPASFAAGGGVLLVVLTAVVVVPARVDRQ